MSFRCDFCEKEFQREHSFMVHVCEAKRRWQERNDMGVQLALRAYLRFYEITQGSSRLRTWEDFSRSQFYRAFVKFGRHCQAIRAVNVHRFVDWLIRGNHRIDHWCSDQIYHAYLMELVRTESARDVIDRAREQAQEWSESTGNPARDYLRFGNVNAVCYAVSSARVSAWILYNTDSGLEFLSRLRDEHVAMIWPWIDADFWQKRFQDFPADAAWVRETLGAEGW